MRRSDRVGAVLGAVCIAGNVVAVVFLLDVEGAYRVAGLDAWARDTAAHPRATVASAAAFTVGLLALAGWAVALGRRATGDAARWGSAAMALGAVLNAAGTTTPAVLALHVLPGCSGEACLPVARALLGITLTLDALFNLLFGAGLVAVAVAFARAEGRRALAALGVAAGVATLPVSLQFAVDAASNLLAIAGPLWLAYVAITSVILWRGERAEAAGSTARWSAEGGAPDAAVARSR